jgi:hypothetical protein
LKPYPPHKKIAPGAVPGAILILLTNPESAGNRARRVLAAALAGFALAGRARTALAGVATALRTILAFAGVVTRPGRARRGQAQGDRGHQGQSDRGNLALHVTCSMVFNGFHGFIFQFRCTYSGKLILQHKMERCRM